MSNQLLPAGLIDQTLSVGRNNEITSLLQG